MKTMNLVLSVATLGCIVTVGEHAAPARASSGSDGAETTASNRVAFSNFDANGGTTGFIGWGLTGSEDVSGSFNYQGEQFIAAASGHVTRLRIPLYRTVSETNNTVNMNLYTDSPANPGTPDVLLQVIPVTPWPQFKDVPITVTVTNGATLAVGQYYWLIAQPGAGLQASWALNNINETGLHLDASAKESTYTTNVQGAFEIEVAP